MVLTNWGQTNIGGTNTNSAHSRLMGGTSPALSGMKLSSISMYLGAQDANVRLGVYVSGALDNPTGADLLWDAGTIGAGDATLGWKTIGHPTGIPLPSSQVIWLAWKRDSGRLVYYDGTSNPGNHDFQNSRGRNDQAWSNDEATTFPTSIDAAGSFTNYWYSIYITYTSPSFRISGITKDNNGNPLGYCKTFLWSVGTSSLSYVDYISSNVDGEYIFSGLIHDTYLVNSLKDDDGTHKFDVTDHVLQGIKE